MQRDNVVSFEHAIGAKVRIDQNGIDGHVIGQWNGRDGLRYSVEYADRNGAIFDRWFRGDEVVAA
jgi:hypothetical protein